MEHKASHLYGVLGLVRPVAIGHGHLDFIMLFNEAQTIVVTLEGYDQKRVDFLNKSIRLEVCCQHSYLSFLGKVL